MSRSNGLKHSQHASSCNCAVETLCSDRHMRCKDEEHLGNRTDAAENGAALALGRISARILHGGPRSRVRCIFAVPLRTRCAERPCAGAVSSCQCLRGTLGTTCADVSAARWPSPCPFSKCLGGSCRCAAVQWPLLHHSSRRCRWRMSSSLRLATCAMTWSLTGWHTRKCASARSRAASMCSQSRRAALHGMLAAADHTRRRRQRGPHPRARSQGGAASLARPRAPCAPCGLRHAQRLGGGLTAAGAPGAPAGRGV